MSQIRPVPKRRAAPEVPEAMAGFAVRLRAAREEKDLNRTELADASGVDKGTISRLERGLGVSGVTATTVLRLAVALGVRPGWLLDGHPPRTYEPSLLVHPGVPADLVDAVRKEIREGMAAALGQNDRLLPPKPDDDGAGQAAKRRRSKRDGGKD